MALQAIHVSHLKKFVSPQCPHENVPLEDDQEFENLLTIAREDHGHLPTGIFPKHQKNPNCKSNKKKRQPQKREERKPILLKMNYCKRLKTSWGRMMM